MLRVGIVGAGLIGAKRARAVSASADARLVAVADEDHGRASALAQEHGCSAHSDWEAVVSQREVDAVIIATTHNWLAPIGQRALECGKSVLCEKPMAITSQEAERLVATAAQNHLTLKVGFNHRYHGAVFDAQQRAQAGAIGRLLFIRCRYGHGGRSGYEKEWRCDPSKSGGGELLDQGIHLLDLCRWFLGEFSDVYAVLPRLFWPTIVEDNAFCTLQTSSGQVASIHTSWTQWKNIFSFEVFGEAGYLIAEGLGGHYGRERLLEGRRPPQFGVPQERITEYDGQDTSWDREWTDFVSAIRHNRRPLGDGHDGWQALLLAEAAYSSAKHKRPISMR